ncbi:hypothetical protein IHE44_0005394 [Lamprotornis superbus]|uniref:Integrator complex subunit 6-like beta-barrel domain-containing protein n=1 Tax=Lamprotornis superbus TaxID=245042 RepID=A0A835NM78_9PASS|nr:hypothetical protein IHE44_0005394 [Lamprotornis superbus]
MGIYNLICSRVPEMQKASYRQTVGRNPFFLEPAIIITVTDGSKLTTTSGIQEEVYCVPAPESEQMTGVPVDDSAITPMCEVTGDGQVEISRPFGPQPWHSCHKLIYVRPNPKTGVPIGHWPVPESFWPDQNSPTLPPRTSHPVVKFSCTDCEPMVIDKLPFDKYELEPSPLTQFILERKSPQTCWQVYVSNSAKYSELGHPFGYLKASTALNCVNLFVMPYNYPVLLPLLDQVHSVPIAQMGNYQEYLKQIPSPLRELDPDQPRRLHTFGNPFKLDKKGMMIDEADEFVSGPQNKHKRPGEPNMQGIPKRRRCMSPLLRGRPQTPPVVSNHIGGKGPPTPIAQAQPDLVKPIAIHKTSETNNEIGVGVIGNHVTDPLSSDVFPNAVDSEFSLSSSTFNSLDRPTAHIEDYRVLTRVTWLSDDPALSNVIPRTSPSARKRDKGGGHMQSYMPRPKGQVHVSGDPFLCVGGVGVAEVALQQAAVSPARGALGKVRQELHARIHKEGTSQLDHCALAGVSHCFIHHQIPALRPLLTQVSQAEQKLQFIREVLSCSHESARDKVSTKASGFSEEVLKRGVSRKRKEPWVLPCFILDMELQV